MIISVVNVVHSQIPMIDKHKPVPRTTYDYPKDYEILDKAKQENRQASLVCKPFYSAHAVDNMSKSLVDSACLNCVTEKMVI